MRNGTTKNLAKGVKQKTLIKKPFKFTNVTLL